MNNDVGGGAVIGQAPAEHDTDDELLVASGHSGGVTSSSKKTYQRVVAPTSHGTVRLKSKPKILEEVKEQSTALMEIVIFSVFLSFNLLCLLIGIICYNEGLGTLWMEISGEYEYEYDFGWRKSITVHKGHPGIDFEHSNVYDADLEAAGGVLTFCFCFLFFAFGILFPHYYCTLVLFSNIVVISFCI